jgi:hypothetical protein
MAKRKLDGCRRQWHMVTLADDVDPCHAFENPHWRWLIIIFCSRRSTGRQNSRVEWAANQQRKTLLLGEWQEIVETVLLKQRVSAREQEAIERGFVGEANTGRDLVDPYADGPDHA